MLSWTQRPLYSFACTLLLLFFVVINTPSKAAVTATEPPALSSTLFGPNAGKYGPEILPDTTWAWDSSQYNNDTEARPEDSRRYTINFRANGTIGIRADCNIVQGSYTTENKSLLIRLGPGTMAACDPGSLDRRFLKDLEGSAVWFLKQGDLFLDLKADTGTMKFYRLLE